MLTKIFPPLFCILLLLFPKPGSYSACSRGREILTSYDSVRNMFLKKQPAAEALPRTGLLPAESSRSSSLASNGDFHFCNGDGYACALPPPDKPDQTSAAGDFHISNGYALKLLLRSFPSASPGNTWHRPVWGNGAWHGRAGTFRKVCRQKAHSRSNQQVGIFKIRCVRIYQP